MSSFYSHLLSSYGICSMMGFFYSAAHTVMPFLLLGIGIDDMFVITQVSLSFFTLPTNSSLSAGTPCLTL